jgi:hypothetical protein
LHGARKNFERALRINFCENNFLSATAKRRKEKNAHLDMEMSAHVITPSRDSRARVEDRGVCSGMVRVCWKGGARWELVRMLLVLLSLTSTSTSSTQDIAARSSPTTAGAGGRCFAGKGGAGMSGEKGNRNGAERVGVFLRGASTNPKVGQCPRDFSLLCRSCK